MAKTSETTAGGRGQKINRSFGRDDSSMPLNDAQSRNGGEMGGSTTNLSHSMTGGSAVQSVKKGGK